MAGIRSGISYARSLRGTRNGGATRRLRHNLRFNDEESALLREEYHHAGTNRPVGAFARAVLMDALVQRKRIRTTQGAARGARRLRRIR